MARGTSAKETKGKNGTGKRGDVCHTAKFITTLSNTEQQLLASGIRIQSGKQKLL